ncbi:MAG: hypothetical protein ACTSXA_12240 [Candidatus Heimdallarchaeota archaeon]
MNSNPPSNLSFLVVIENEPPQQNFSLKDLPSASKIDVIARNILALFPNQTANLNITYYAFFTQKTPKVLVVKNLVIDDSNSDEIFIASKIRDALEITSSGENDNQMTWISVLDFQSFIETISAKNDVLFYLKEDGSNYVNHLTKSLLEKKTIFILGGRRDISDIHEEILHSFNIKKISLGKKAYLASQCLSLITYEFEKLLSH